ncbi:hypothetical protein [Clostridium sp. D33t1_170424_F3]|uniref:hypothetical protein n=1 Tax=Clostridium sp. D33t1_170424_F3 TaxID=2787099 RepID=UPI0018A8AECD|nr:hypothetical protein [Clostridium sp. D33t1_170424_F3]
MYTFTINFKDGTCTKFVHITEAATPRQEPISEERFMSKMLPEIGRGELHLYSEDSQYVIDTKEVKFYSAVKED